MSVLAEGSAGALGASTVLARLTRVALYHREPLLRAREFQSWCGQDEMRPATQEALRQPVGDPRRAEAAAAVERDLLESAAFVGLWRERWSCDADPRLVEGVTGHELLPPWPSALHWHPAANLRAHGEAP